MYFGKRIEMTTQLVLNNAPIQWTEEWKYLGVMLKSGNVFGNSVKEKTRSFYRSLNSILRIEGRSDDLILLQLIETHCVPILTYGIEVIHVSQRDEKRSLRVAYNAIFRKLFGYRWFESVTDLQHSLGRKTWEELCETRRHCFLQRARACPEQSLVRAFC